MGVVLLPQRDELVVDFPFFALSSLFGPVISVMALIEASPLLGQDELVLASNFSAVSSDSRSMNMCSNEESAQIVMKASESIQTYNDGTSTSQTYTASTSINGEKEESVKKGSCRGSM